MRKLLLLPLAIGLALAVPASAQAWYITHFIPSDRGSRIRYAVSVCGAKHRRVLFSVYLHTDQGIGPTYTGDWRVRNTGRYCDRWLLSESDQYAEGVWDAQVRAVVGGRPRWTLKKYFYIR